MYTYTMKAVPGCKAQFDGDTSVRYEIRRKHTSTSAPHKSRTDVIRTDLGYTAAAALVKKFNDKEREARLIKNWVGSRLTPKV